MCFFNDTATTEIYTLSLHDALPIFQIVREEMDAIGGQEMLMPVLTPAELWEASGRYGIPEVFKLEDRGGRRFVLPMTHEETVRSEEHTSELQSRQYLVSRLLLAKQP